MSPGVAMMAIGFFGGVDSLCRGREGGRAARKLSQASFCIYLVHMFFLYLLTGLGITVQLLPCLISIPILVAAVLACCCAAYLILSRIPFVKRYLI
jgi:surface polysaccharide O-acyltransferase-like enzyme